MDSTPCEKTLREKCWYKSTHILHPFRIPLQWIPQHKHYQFCLCFSGRGPDPSVELCSCRFSHPAQIWPQASPTWKQEDCLFFFPSIPLTNLSLSQNMTLTTDMTKGRVYLQESLHLDWKVGPSSSWLHILLPRRIKERGSSEGPFPIT